MDLLTGINHVAVVTEDLDRFVAFYTDVFELDVVFEETTPAFRHAILRTGESSWLHPAEIAGNAHGHALPAMFGRGHLDHVGLTARSIEAFGAEGHPVHKTLLGAGMVILEGLDFRRVTPGTYELYCLPLRIAGGDGSPCRAILRG